ncbi:MAG: hypothetical protein WC544_01910 [Patescibacteria group bacterium]
MRYNLGLSLLAGLIIGGVLGAIFYIVPAKLLICGPIPTDNIMLPPGVQDFVLKETFHWGVIPGLIIGLMGGLNTNATLPRGHFSKGIGVWCYLVCTIAAWWTQWEFLAYTSGGRIALTAGITLVMFVASLFISQAVSFIEAIRE